MTTKLVKIIISILLALIMIAVIRMNVGVYYKPDIKGSGETSLNVDVLMELRGLKEALNNGADTELQEIFPEGYLFINALYGLTWCNFLEGNQASEYAEEGLAEIQHTWGRINSDVGRQPFELDLVLPYGAFYSGWSTYFLARKLSLGSHESRNSGEVLQFKEQCDRISKTIQNDPYPASYAGGIWPADVMMCVAALAWHDKLFNPEYDTIISEWIQNVKMKTDDHGLVPHSINPTNGQPREQARGSSMGLMLIFLKDIDSLFAAEQFQIYKSMFYDSAMGLPGIREYPKGVYGTGDVDSGPVFFQMGSAATIVGMQTFSVYREVDTSIRIRNALEAVALPMKVNRNKTYLFGLMPMADAFIAWGHSAIGHEPHNIAAFYTFHFYSLLIFMALMITAGLMWREWLNAILQKKQ